MKRGIQTLKGIFEENISVMSIAEPIQIQMMDSYKAYAEENNFDSVLIRDGEELLVFDRVKSEPRPVREHEIISDSTPLQEALKLVIDTTRLFVMERSRITSIVTVSDLDKIPVRIWLFGLISLTEYQIKEVIRNMEIEWEELLSEGRLGKAKSLYKEKEVRNEEIDLLQCIQFSDISTIITKNELLFAKMTSISSRKQCQSKFGKANELRDKLAHSQKLNEDWKKIYDLSVFLEGILNDTGRLL